MPDRSRPPQVDAAAHTCTESADRTAPAKHSGIRSSRLPAEPAKPGGRNRGCGGELFLTLQFPEEHAVPSVQDTLYCLRDLYDGHCV